MDLHYAAEADIQNPLKDTVLDSQDTADADIQNSSKDAALDLQYAAEAEIESASKDAASDLQYTAKAEGQNSSKDATPDNGDGNDKEKLIQTYVYHFGDGPTSLAKARSCVAGMAGVTNTETNGRKIRVSGRGLVSSLIESTLKGFAAKDAAYRVHEVDKSHFDKG